MYAAIAGMSIFEQHVRLRVVRSPLRAGRRTTLTLPRWHDVTFTRRCVPSVFRAALFSALPQLSFVVYDTSCIILLRCRGPRNPGAPWGAANWFTVAIAWRRCRRRPIHCPPRYQTPAAGVRFGFRRLSLTSSTVREAPRSPTREERNVGLAITSKRLEHRIRRVDDADARMADALHSLRAAHANEEDPLHKRSASSFQGAPLHSQVRPISAPRPAALPQRTDLSPWFASPDACPRSPSSIDCLREGNHVSRPARSRLPCLSTPFRSTMFPFLSLPATPSAHEQRGPCLRASKAHLLRTLLRPRHRLRSGPTARPYVPRRAGDNRWERALAKEHSPQLRRATATFRRAKAGAVSARGGSRTQVPERDSCPRPSRQTRCATAALTHHSCSGAAAHTGPCGVRRVWMSSAVELGHGIRDLKAHNVGMTSDPASPIQMSLSQTGASCGQRPVVQTASGAALWYGGNSAQDHTL